MIWLGIAVGVVIMQFATLIIIYISHENEVVSMIFSVFLFYSFILLIYKVVTCIKKKKQKVVQHD